MLFHFWDALTKLYIHFFKDQTLDVFASVGGKIKKSWSISSPCKKAVMSIEFIFHSWWAIKMTAKLKPLLKHVGESLRMFDVCSSKLLATMHALGICLSSIFLIEQTHLQLSNGWSDLTLSKST